MKRSIYVKKYAERKDTIKSVRLVIDAYDGRELEIPLEVWQVDVIREMLGLSVDTTNLDTYCMRSKNRPMRLITQTLLIICFSNMMKQWINLF